MRHAFPVLVALGACAPSTDDTDDTDDTDLVVDTDDSDVQDTDETDETDAEATAVTLTFDARVAGAAASCGGTYDDVGTADTTVTLKDFRVYVHDVVVLVDGGAPVPVTLATNDWQSNGVALLDFEDGTGPCAEFGTTATNPTITGTLPAGVVPTGLAFTLGVPPALNHVDPLGAEPPLDASGLYWVWRSGYKYLRIDLLNENEAPDNGWFVHLGAAGCVSDTPQTPPPEACAKPNLPRVVLDGVDPLTDTIVLDAAALVANADVSTNTEGTPSGCMMNPAEPAECDPVLAALGLDAATGLCDDACSDQTFVSVE